MGLFFNQEKPRQFHLPGFKETHVKKKQLETKTGRRKIHFKRKTNSSTGVYSLLILIACLAVVIFIIKFFS